MASLFAMASRAAFELALSHRTGILSVVSRSSLLPCQCRGFRLEILCKLCLVAGYLYEFLCSF